MLKKEQAIFKNNIVVADWSEISKAEYPPKKRDLYIIVQKLDDGTSTTGAAWYQQDANGIWDFNKPNITHWQKWPEMPKKV
jgi:hypothetical protein